MATKLAGIINSISSVFANDKKAKPANKSSESSKLYTFMIIGEGVRKSVNIKAPDKLSAERKIHLQYPDCRAEFLWELVRSTPGA